jgi:hypothetical protein
VNTTYNSFNIGVSTGLLPGVIQLTNLPKGSYLVTGNVNLSYGIDPAGHRWTEPFCGLYASDGGAAYLNVGQAALVTMELPYTTDYQQLAIANLAFSGWVTLASSSNVVLASCSVQGTWGPTTLNTQYQTITAMQAAVTKSAGSAF